MKMSRIKKRIAATMMVFTLSVWFALPNVAHAQTITIEGRSIHTYLTVSSSSVTATISYAEGSGKVWALAIGDACNILDPDKFKSVLGPKVSNPTPGGASSSADAPDGWRFYHGSSVCEYEVYINGTTYKDMITEGLSLE